MKKTRKIVSAILVASLVVTPLLSDAVQAKDSITHNDQINSEQTNADLIEFVDGKSYDIADFIEEDFYDKVDAEIDGEIYTIETIKENGTTIINVTDKNGTITFSTLDDSEHIDVESDFLTDDELDTVENDLESIVVIEEASDDELVMTPFAQTGSWTIGKDTNYTVTANGKFTAQTIIAAIGSRLGIYGLFASTFANIMIQYNMKTGYYTKRGDHRRDTSSNYLWFRTRTTIWKDSKRKTIIRSLTSDPVKKWIGI